MEISDFPKTQQDFLKRISESSARLAGVWMDSMKGVKAENAPGDHLDAGLGWMNPRAFQGILNSPSATTRFQEMIVAAASDLPELMSHGRDKATVTRIQRKWLQAYRNFVREILGIPPRSKAEQYLEQWRTMLAGISSAGSRFSGGLFPDFSAMISTMETLFQPSTVPSSNLPNMLLDQYQRTFAQLFSLPGGSLKGAFEDRAKRAVDAQVTFLDALSEFQEHIVAAAAKGLEDVVERTVAVGGEQIGPETYRTFSEVWIASHEEALADLFRSDGFMKIVLNTMKQGVDAKRQMASLVGDSLSLRNVPSRNDLESLHDEVHLLRGRIVRLEEEIELLKAQ